VTDTLPYPLVPALQIGAATVFNADCLAVLRTMPADSVDSVVTDPPYGLSNTSAFDVTDTIVRWAAGAREYVPRARGFMGNAWDGFVPPPAVWDEVYRVLKPGGHLLAFAGTRTQDLMGLSIRFAGFDIRDSIAWLHAQGFPHGLDIGKAIDKELGANRTAPKTPATAEAEAWDGWGTSLKPAFEPVIMARKPLDGTVGHNVLAHGVGGLNLAATRIGTDEVTINSFDAGARPFGGAVGEAYTSTKSVGRWPANAMLDEHQAAELDRQSGFTRSRSSVPRAGKAGAGWGMTTGGQEHNDEGGASRFFFVAKPKKADKPVVDGIAHPTVKPVPLMRELVRLVTPVGGLVLDPFGGSGTTAEAAVEEGMNVIAIEAETSFIPLIALRLNRVNGTAA
jgi:DNA modification methylase